MDFARKSGGVSCTEHMQEQSSYGKMFVIA